MAMVSNRDDVIDSREVIERIKELEEEIDLACCDIEEQDDGTFKYQQDDGPIQIFADEESAKKEAIENAGLESEVIELAELKALAEECEGYSDWAHGEQLIRDDYFETYAQNLAEELDLVQSDVKWPYTCIDWEKAASELQMDYTSVDFGEVTYWIRS